MKQIEISGKNLEEALRLAMIQLDATKEEINYNVIEEGSKGFLGIGAKELVISVWKNESTTFSVEEKAAKFLSNILSQMNIDADAEIVVEDDQLNIELVGTNMAVVIGKHGQTLDAIQYLTSLVVNKDSENYTRISIDTEGYREKRKEALESLADRLASRVKRSRKSVILEPMNPYERRIIHSRLHSTPGIGTRSEGMDPERKVVIFYDSRRK